MISISCHALLLPFIFLSLLANTDQMVVAKGKDNVRDACRVTRYQKLCVRSLAPFSNSAGRSPSKWARAGVSVTIGEIKNVEAYLAKLKRHGRIRGRERVALSDCVESFSDALYELHKSLGVLRRLSRSTFGTQTGDIKTWISAALINEDTCLHGFQGKKEREIKLLLNRVLKVYYVTSNALALVNKLATTGIGSMSDP
ncbi:pectinesterase inhibitor 6-like [Abrus precatorius]|uniref:Pectinesterase inhibitor 6-like n=1 Tax=Abrus precatorius TaxID=3816 RepID=A0A8B8MFB5_ABRPR|nr:pectinesterase inhibitor 6-like [Abrus precatorius]